ncbi:MAG: hypothetical protein EZS28_044965 [Streblomastix strix]|uniref:Uncharacterized protein n=1 Tax=Streblomastix strix TaxID=222440 RepID=A0A5J4TMQ4_9EUKA|nr:MAG: hypothetical protein EZS28_044965 [Streblomastix strix]
MQRFLIIGESSDVIKLGGRMRKQRKHHPLDRMIIAVIQGKVENLFLNGLYNKEDQIMKQFKEQQTVGIVYVEDID